MLAEEILIVNDGSLLLQMMGGLLENKGYHLNLTDSPEEALVLLSTRNVMLVVLKLNGQAPDRLAVMHMVKELNGGTKLIIMGDGPDLPAEIFEIEADDYILLPCRAAEIWRRVLSSLEAAPAQPTASWEQGLAHPVNQRVLNKLALMFHNIRSLTISINEGLKILSRETNGRLASELENIFQETFQSSRTLISTAEEFLQKFQDQNSMGSSINLVDLREDVVNPILAELREDLRRNSISLDNRLALLPSVQQVVRGEREALKSVFRNLLNNAIAYGGQGCTICIEVDEAPTYFRLQVQNTGAPLPGHQANLFPGIKRAQGDDQGMGLGLHLGREIMRSHGGDIALESGQQGLNFIITLPRAHL